MAKPTKRVAPTPIRVPATPNNAPVPVPPATDVQRVPTLIDIDGTPLDARNAPSGIPYGGV
jgi:hypothetical protein